MLTTNLLFSGRSSVAGCATFLPPFHANYEIKIYFTWIMAAEMSEPAAADLPENNRLVVIFNIFSCKHIYNNCDVLNLTVSK